MTVTSALCILLHGLQNYKTQNKTALGDQNIELLFWRDFRLSGCAIAHCISFQSFIYFFPITLDSISTSLHLFFFRFSPSFPVSPCFYPHTFPDSVSSLCLFPSSSLSVSVSVFSLFFFLSLSFSFLFSICLSLCFSPSPSFCLRFCYLPLFPLSLSLCYSHSRSLSFFLFFLSVSVFLPLLFSVSVFLPVLFFLSLSVILPLLVFLSLSLSFSHSRAGAKKPPRNEWSSFFHFTPVTSVSLLPREVARLASHSLQQSL